MKLTKDTIALLKNFSTINGNLLLKPGNTIMTIAADKTVYACATVPETFPCEFGIYDLAEFLGSISMFEDADIEFNATHAQIKTPGGSLKLFKASSDVLTFPAKKLVFPASEVEFSLTASQLTMVQRICATIRANDVAIKGTDGKLTLEASDKANSASNEFKLDLGETDKEFTAYMKASNLKCLPYDYKVSLSKKAVKFQFNDIEYVFVLEADSVF